MQSCVEKGFVLQKWGPTWPSQFLEQKQNSTFSYARASIWVGISVPHFFKNNVGQFSSFLKGNSFVVPG